MLAQWHFWTAFLGTGALLVLLAWLGSRRRRLSPKQVAAGGYPAACGSCGYDLTGLPGNICPECGSDLELVGRLSPRFYRWSTVPITARLIVWTIIVACFTAGMLGVAREIGIGRFQRFDARIDRYLRALIRSEYPRLNYVQLTLGVRASFVRPAPVDAAIMGGWGTIWPGEDTRWQEAVIEVQRINPPVPSEDGEGYSWPADLPRIAGSSLVYLEPDPTGGARVLDFRQKSSDVEPAVGLERAIALAIRESGYQGEHGSPEHLASAVLPSVESFLKFGAPTRTESTSAWQPPQAGLAIAYAGTVREPELHSLYLATMGCFAFLVWLLGLPFILRKRPMSIRRDAMAVQTMLAVSLLLAPLLTGCITVKPPPPGETVKATLPRPLIVIGGIYDPNRSATGPARYVRDKTGEERILAVHPGFAWSFNSAADIVVDAVERYFPSDNPDQTIEVDVIGVSMGGLVARHAAAPGQNGARKRLNIRRLYTVAAPHSGAVMADMFGFMGTPQQMRTGGPFMRSLAQREQATTEDDYDLVAYSRGRDQVIGAGIELPPHLHGTEIHFDPRWYAPGHMGVHRDKRILADIVARLRQPPPPETLQTRAN